MVKRNNSRIRILTFLLSHKREEFTIRSISKKIRADYKTIYLEMRQLIQDNLVFAKKRGQAVLCSLNPYAFHEDIFRAELTRQKKLCRNKNFSVLQSYFKELAEPFFILLIFGSYASGRPRAGSDIDLMLIADNDELNKELRNKISLIPLKIHAQEFTSREFLSMLKTTSFNVGREAFYNNIILFGIEDYYRLIQHA